LGVPKTPRSSSTSFFRVTNKTAHDIHHGLFPILIEIKSNVLLLTAYYLLLTSLTNNE
jgi:hypothetical protein